MLIRDATADDWPALWPIFRAIVRAGETYTYDPAISEGDARAMWMVGPPGRTIVAASGGGVLGTANMYANRPGPGAHVASASFMVDEAARGTGVGRALGEEVVAWSRAQGFRAIQFNAVVETNEVAVHLWQALGFRIVGTVPGAFRHPLHGDVGLHVMHLPLDR